jgi:hypothetical protein
MCVLRPYSHGVTQDPVCCAQTGPDRHCELDKTDLRARVFGDTFPNPSL